MRRDLGLLFTCVLVMSATVASSAWCAEAGLPTPVDAKSGETKSVETKPGPKLECLKPGETAEEICSRHFVEAYVVLRTAAHEAKAEALSAKLCKLGDDWVYSVALLHRDGHFVHMLLDATTGHVFPPHGHEPPKP